MGRQAYLNRLALGRSPYDAPDYGAVDPSSTVRRVSSIHADDYMQQYDHRGHPVNPESKVLGRGLRRAKNDILSTMGIVVSGEDRQTRIPNEQQKINQIATENDFGLVMTTLDQLFVFFGTWWTTSLTARILTYRRYTHAALLDVIRSERGSTGVVGFYFAGIPAWAVSSGFTFARETPLKRTFTSVRDYLMAKTGDGSLSPVVRSVFGVAYTAARTSVLMFSVEAYMYSLLQSLSLVAPNSVPSLRLFIPFGAESLIQLPPLPTEFTFQSIGASLTGLLTSPAVLVLIYAYYLRPELEERLYRLIRRRLPKPTLADELSVRVAFEENLIEWVVPTLGRRSEEEIQRAKLTFLQDVQCELAAFRGWVFSWFGLRSRHAPDQQTIEPARDDRIESLRNSIETLQNELEGAQSRNHTAERGPDELLERNLAATPFSHVVDITQPDLLGAAQALQSDVVTTTLAMNQVLTNENRMSQSPGEMSSDYFSEMATLGQASALSTSSNPHDHLTHQDTQHGEGTAMDRQNSRSNTLFSHPSSPDTSPPTSPRVRASLIHQSSDIITMQLELLGNRNRNAQNQTRDQDHLTVRPSTDDPSRPPSTTVDRRSIAEFLDALISSQHHTTLSPQHAVVHQSIAADSGALTDVVAEPDPPMPETQPPHPLPDAAVTDHPALESTADVPVPSTTPNLLPDGVEEPNDDDEDESHTHPPPAPGPDLHQNPDIVELDSLMDQPPLTSATTLPFPSQSFLNPSSMAHRVTLLSAHPIDSLASHLAALLSVILLSPLESLSLRSLAHSYLGSAHRSSSSSAIQLADLHPLGLWFGATSWSDAFAYTGRLVLMRGMQAALRAGVWGFLVGSTMRIGRSFCGWGKL
ncbi:hypothetical protein N7474_008459 [Penicillium riverlandense]|uniref:uncharacterized protein n=1 Tax=Penicillium riverlandense TaxID=1903569 RepID=UPI002548EB38|nr:uncharacterized protein N7474_008459 [Penicillium riverlandense]KAJ5812158.1 hypothetical protein N7474_008459 [Penicillium riverlandense]